MDLHERWARVVGRPPNERFALDEAALIIAAHIDPDVDVDAEVDRLDALAAECFAGTLDSVTDLLFARLGLHGDRRDYDDPRNSSIPQVLDRGVGIPISLSVLLMEVGRRHGLHLEGVGMPGHFLVRHVVDGGDADVLIDPFGAGRHLSPGACRDLWSAIQGSPAGWSPDMLASTPPVAIVVRMLANLTGSYTRRDDLGGRRWVAELRAALPERSTNQRLIVASELAQTGAFNAAAEIIDTTANRIAGLDGDNPDAARLRAHARNLRARLN
ncbi:MAG: transglutaminase-like domain-containing protein [Actinomycetota bacterium]|nr:transglutaminase-like domain-containing protein [Actinomycetota bacterium]